MLSARIQQDLFDFIGNDLDEAGPLTEFWYGANSAALSAALVDQPGFSLVVNVASFQAFEHLAKRLFLLADTLIIRDTRQFTEEETTVGEVLIPTGEYKPGYWADIGAQLKQLRPAPLALQYKPELMWTSTHKNLSNGYQAAYAMGRFSGIPRDFVTWITGAGRGYLNTGQVIYAPFIPPLAMELEFLKNGVSLPDQFNATPFFHQNYDWLSEERIQALLSIKVPFLDGIDITTIHSVKEDHRDEFGNFSRALSNSITGMKAAMGTEAFAQEVRYIQRNQIDAALSDVGRTIKKIEKMKSLRQGSLLTGLIGINAAAYMFGVPEVTAATGAATALASVVTERVAQLRETSELKEKPGYFLWTLGQRAK